MLEKKCGNCEHFCRFYIKLQSYFMKTELGHCRYREILWQTRKPRAESDAACEGWSSRETVEEERKKDIYASLKRMARRVDEIAWILKTDK